MKKIMWIVLALAVAGNAYLFVKLIDAGSIIDNARSEAKRQRERAALTLVVARRAWVGRSEQDLRRMIDENKDVISRSEDASVEFGDLVFSLKNGTVTAVDYFDGSPSLL
jgi:hypothetical protein